MSDIQTPYGPEPVDPKFKELAQFVMDQLWSMQARTNVLETVVQQLAIELAKGEYNPQAWLELSHPTTGENNLGFRQPDCESGASTNQAISFGGIFQTDPLLSGAPHKKGPPSSHRSKDSPRRALEGLWCVWPVLGRAPPT